MGEYNSLHVAVVQLMSGQGILEKQKFHEIFEDLKSYYSEKLQVSSVTPESALETINEKIAKFDLSIRLTKYEYSDEEFYVFISTTSSPESRFQNLYTDAEIQYFPLVMREIITSDEGSISPIEALNLVSKLQKPLLKMRAGELLSAWKDSGYFREMDESIHLGPRALVEFDGYITMNYAEFIKSCFVCQKTVYQSFSCSSSSCDADFHSSCINRYHENFPNSCPSCKGDWTTD